jgi:hypothetical protein
VTPDEWDTCTEPREMLSFLRESGAASDRKLRLFACACCHRIRHLLLPEAFEALKVESVGRSWPEANKAAGAWLAAVIRDLFGDPFRPVTFSPSLLAPTVASLASAAYEHRLMPSGHLDPARLAVLADALLDAGCDDVQLLEHLRGEGPHWRGCFAVDAVLSKG